MDEERAEVVARLAAAMMAPRDVDDVTNLFNATAEERAAADRIVTAEQWARLADAGTVRRAPSLLDMDLHQVRRLAWQGAALTELLTMIEGRWGPYPDRALSSILMAEPRGLLGELAVILHRAGITDLDDYLPDSRPGGRPDG